MYVWQYLICFTFVATAFVAMNDDTHVILVALVASALCGNEYEIGSLGGKCLCRACVAMHMIYDTCSLSGKAYNIGGLSGQCLDGNV